MTLAVASRPGAHVGVMLDTKGPEIRTGMLEGHKTVEYKKGSKVEITTDYTALGNSEKYGHTPHAAMALPSDSFVPPGGIFARPLKACRTQLLTRVVTGCFVVVQDCVLVQGPAHHHQSRVRPPDPMLG
jgi:hypothetical protein